MPPKQCDVLGCINDATMRPLVRAKDESPRVEGGFTDEEIRGMGRDPRERPYGVIVNVGVACCSRECAEKMFADDNIRWVPVGS